MERHIFRVGANLAYFPLDFPIHLVQGLLGVTKWQNELFADLLSELVIELDKCEANIPLLYFPDDFVYIFNFLVMNLHQLKRWHQLSIAQMIPFAGERLYLLGRCQDVNDSASFSMNRHDHEKVLRNTFIRQ